MMIEKLRIINNDLKKKTNDKKYFLIEKILKDDKAFFKMDIETSFSILRDLEIKEENIKKVYEELIDAKNYSE